MKEKLKTLFGPRLPREERAGFQADVYASYYRPMLVMAVLILLMEAVMLVSQAFFPSPTLAARERVVYLLLYASLFAVTLGVYVTAKARRAAFERAPGRFLAMCAGYCAFICAWGSFFSAYSHRYAPNIAVFTYITLATATLLVAVPWQAIGLYLLNELYFLLLCFAFRAPGISLYDTVVNSLFVTVLAALIATAMNHSRVVNYAGKRTIQSQSEQIQAINEQLNALVLTDELTGMYNRRYLDEMVPDMIEDARQAEEPPGLMMIDIDKFKQYNDIYGHQEGDRCLARVADILRSTLLASQAPIIRYGGEEFVVYVQGMEREDLHALAEKLRANLARTRIEHTGSPFGIVTISIGACLGRPQDGLYALLHQADEALYAAKSAGRNQTVLYTPAEPDDADPSV